MQVLGLPLVLVATVHAGVRDVAEVKAPFEGSVGHMADQLYESAWASESTAVTLRLTTPSDATGLGEPVGPAVIVKVCDGGGEVHVHVGLSVPSQHAVRPLEQPQTPLCDEQQPDWASRKGPNSLA